MPVLAMLLKLSDEPGASRDVLEFLGMHPAFTLGPSGPAGLPLVVESQTRAEERKLCDMVVDHPGVLFGTVLMSDFSDLVEGDSFS